jgi:hypothetical protein
VFPVRYGLNSYINLLRTSVFKWLIKVWTMSGDVALGYSTSESTILHQLAGQGQKLSIQRTRLLQRSRLHKAYLSLSAENL